VVINQRVSGYSETLFSFDGTSMVTEGSQERSQPAWNVFDILPEQSRRERPGGRQDAEMQARGVLG
jgi:hypothetical protein